MYRHSPVRNPRSKGIKIKNVLQVCLLVAVCFWLIFQVKRSYDKKKEFDATDKLATRIRNSGEIVKFGRKDLPPKLDETVKEVEKHEDEHEQEEEEDNKHEVEEEVEEEKIDEEKDDEIDENGQEKSDMEIDREEVDIIDEDKETEESESDKENEESQTVDHDEEHTHELREEHYQADDASSAVTHNGRSLGTENEIKNGSLETFSNIQENEPEPLVNPTSSIDFLENGPPSNTTVITSDSTQDQNVTAIEVLSNSTYVSENSEAKVETDEGEETNNVIERTEDPNEVLQHLPEIETEGGNSEDTAAE